MAAGPLTMAVLAIMTCSCTMTLAVPDMRTIASGHVAIRDAALDGGQRGRLVHECMKFLYKHMPAMDRVRIKGQELVLNTELALAARSATPWASAVPWDLFLNNVLPYASLDEPRDEWRAAMHPLLQPMVQNATTITQAAQIINRDLWGLWGIVFKPDQTPDIMSPTQVIAAGYASCTGLSIFLVSAYRAVGIPARVAGTPSWVRAPAAAEGSLPNHDFNNHDWVEVWDDGVWSFVGAAEYDSRGMNRTWFFPQPAKRQIPGSRLHAIYAASFARLPACNTTFPLVWDDAWIVPGCDVTQYYLDAEVLDQD